MSKLKIGLISLFATCVLVLSSLIVLGPFLSLYGIQHSLREDKVVLLNFLVDFPELQNNIKKQVRQKIEDEYDVSLSKSGNAFEQIAKQVFEHMLQLSVETAVSPAGLQFLLSGGDFESVMSQKNEFNQAASGELKFRSYFSHLKQTSLDYQNLGRADIRLANSGQGFQNTTLIFRRDGVIWKLVDIHVDTEQR